MSWWPAQEVPIHPLLDALDFSRGRKNWGYQLRLGLFEVNAADGDHIARAMFPGVTDTGPGYSR